MSNKPQSMLYLLDTSNIFKNHIINERMLLETEHLINSSRDIGLRAVCEDHIPDTIILLGVGDSSAPIIRNSICQCKDRFPDMYPPTIIDGRTCGFELYKDAKNNWTLIKEGSKKSGYVKPECQLNISDCKPYLEDFIRHHWKTAYNFPEYHNRIFKN